MSAADGLAVVLWVAVSAYALLGGADFGGGFWDLTAGTARGGAGLRDRVEHSIGPVWEANHVWLIFALVVLWTGFPAAFAAVASTLYIPLTVVAVGVILRGSAFAFRKTVHGLPAKRALGATFAAASVLTPFFLGAAAGGIASGRVPPGIARGSVVGSWANPTGLLGGVLAVATCAWLAAVYLTGDAARDGQGDLADAFRRRALGAGIAVGVLALSGIAVLHADAPVLFAGLTGRALPLVVVSAAAGMVSLVLLGRRRYRIVRVTGAVAVVAIIWGWGVAQYPKLLVGGPTLASAAAPAPTLHAHAVGARGGRRAPRAVARVPVRPVQRSRPSSERTATRGATVTQTVWSRPAGRAGRWPARQQEFVGVGRRHRNQAGLRSRRSWPSDWHATAVPPIPSRRVSPEASALPWLGPGGPDVTGDRQKEKPCGYCTP